MENKQTKIHSRHTSTFAIQLFECALVAVLFSLSFAIAGKLIYNNAFPFGWIDGFLMYSIMTSIAIIILGANKYFSFISRPFLETLSKITGLVIMMIFIFIALLYFSRSIWLSLYYFIVACTLQVLFLLLIKRVTYALKTNIFRSRVALVIGKNTEKNQMLCDLRRNCLGKVIFASYEDERLKEYIDKANNIFITGFLSKKLKDHVISYCALKDKKVFIVPETYEIAMRKSEMTQIGDIPLFAIESFRLTEAQSIIKRFMDIFLALVGIILSSPIMLYVAIRIKLEDGGPVFYRQIRSGINGKPFKVIKFRSMVVNAEKNTGAIFATENDPRITNIGRVMRATRIDEIPQFFNVLLGSMSMIGPRPERPEFVDDFSRDLPEYANRLAVKPGITGFAQVMGNYTTSPENKAKFDLVYIREYSLLLDIKILFKTINVVFSKTQSAGFTATETEPFYNSAMELDYEIVRPSGSNKSYRNQRIGKVLLVFCCSFIIIFGCVILRFSALTSTMMEVAAQSVTEHNSAEPVSADAGAIVGSIDNNTSSSDSDKSSVMAPENADSSHTNRTDISGPSDISIEEKEGQTYLMSPKNATVEVDEKQGEVVLSQEQINNAMDQISIGEKMGIAYNLISRLSASDLIVLEKLAEGGFTAEEKTAAKEIMYRYYNDEEVQYIKEIYWEYVE